MLLEARVRLALGLAFVMTAAACIHLAVLRTWQQVPWLLIGRYVMMKMVL